MSAVPTSRPPDPPDDVFASDGPAIPGNVTAATEQQLRPPLVLDGALAANLIATSQDIQQIERRLGEAALGPPVERRAVTKEEYASALRLMEDAKRVCREGNEYRASKGELEKELAIARGLVAHTEKEIEMVEGENRKLKETFEALTTKLSTSDMVSTEPLADFMAAQREVRDLEAMRDALAKEVEMLADMDALYRSVQAEELKVHRLKDESKTLREAIVRYKKREEDIEKEHKTHIALMEQDVAKQIKELSAEFGQKRDALKTMLEESNRLREEALQELTNREADLEETARLEMEAKNDELQRLRAHIEELLRTQIAAMRPRCPGDVHVPGTGASPARSAKQHEVPTRDVTVETAKVMTELSAGKRVLSLEILSKGDDFRSPVYWRGGSPTHSGDLQSMDVGVKLHVDDAILRPVPLSKHQTYASSIEQQEQLWCFTSDFGAEVVVGLRVLAPPANPNRRDRVLRTSPSPAGGGLSTTSVSMTRLRSPGSHLYTSTTGR